MTTYPIRQHRMIAGVSQECLLSPTLLNLFLGRILADGLEDHEGSVNTGGRTITNLHFADNNNTLAGKEDGGTLGQDIYNMEINA